MIERAIFPHQVPMCSTITRRAMQYERGERAPGVILELVNRGKHREKVRIYDAYTQRSVTQMLDRHERRVWHWPLEGVEPGRDGVE